MAKSKAFIITLVILSAAGVGLFLQQRQPPQNGKVSLGSDKVLESSFENYDGKTITLSNFRGKPLVINSWAAWCPFCRKELVDFATAQKEFGDKVVIIAIDRAESKVVAKKYSDELGVTDDLVFLLDPADSFYQSIGGFSMPETIFISKDGMIKFHKRGPMGLEEIRQKTKEVL